MGPGLRFIKMHGLGNDFVLIDQRDAPFVLSESLVRAIGDRHRGVGFDQLAEILPDDACAARLIFWNADGSTAGACGNATRCIAHLLMEQDGVRSLGLRTERGLLACTRRDDGLIEVDMGAPSLDWDKVPLREPVDTARLPLDGAPAACSMGNPHCTFFVDDVGAVGLELQGAEIEHHPLFPERTNVQFVQIHDRQNARVRVWERGVGVTLASGSSSCAVLVNAHRRGLMDRRARLMLDGGEIEITLREDDHVLMAGPVAHAFSGVLSRDLLT
ncbi:MAG: diaminopimelate epimerase [Pseudomonadota bacterium]